VESKPKITTAIHYSGLDYRFLRKCVEQSMYFSDEIIVTYYNRLWKSKAPDELHLDKFKDLVDNGIKFLELEFEHPIPHQQYLMVKARVKATEFAKNDYILFLDADEIPDGILMQNWLNKKWINNYEDVYWFTCYWYFRQPVYRALSFEGCGLLTPKNACIWNLNMELDRHQILVASTPNVKHNGSIHSNYIQLNSINIMHHFSWVRDKHEMLIKAGNWGHTNDRNWRTSILEEFKEDFKFTDFVHGYSYEVVPDYFRIGLIK
jgi:hypothetical protein